MESAAHHNTETQKRRSSRIVQAVPLAVMGVDALGRPFHERTSTLIINCHGCRYQSKHYVLKNMWVTLEVPHPEAGHSARSVRARVMWIQRPRTVREPFQVGIELESPGNLWGIAFPPPDWFPFPDSPAQQDVHGAAGELTMEEPTLESVDDESNGGITALEDNVRTMPAIAAADPSSLVLARQVQRLVNEARQQLQAAMRESAAEVVSAETRPLLAALESQLKTATDRAAEVAAGAAVEQAFHNSLEGMQQDHRAQLEAARDRWTGEINESIERTGHKLQARLDEIEHDRHAMLDQQVDERLQQKFDQLRRVADDLNVILGRAQDGLEAFRKQAEESAASLTRDVEQRIAAQTDTGRTQLAQLEDRAQTFRDDVNATLLTAQSAWQERLDTDLAAAGGRWDQRVETSIESAAQQAAERMSGSSRAVTEQFERQINERMASLHQTFTGAYAEAEDKLGGLRTFSDAESGRAQAVLDQLQSAARQAEEQGRALETVRQAAEERLRQSAAALLDAQSEELSRRAQQSVSTWTERLQPLLESTGQQTIERLGADLERQLASRIEKTGAALGQLETEARAVEEALHARQQEIAKTSEETLDATLNHLREAIGRLECDFEETARAATTKWLSELEARTTETTHTTFESLFKTADWYEKKVHTQMQNAVEKGIEQASGGLREKAREISAVFATELDHYSRSYVEHTQGQLEDAAREALERVRQRSAEMAATSSSAVAEQAHHHAESVIHELRDRTGAVLDEVSAQVRTHAEQFGVTLGAEAQRSASEFRAALAQETQQKVGSLQQQMDAQLRSAKNELQEESRAQASHLREAAAGVGDEAMEQYKGRLENASNSWLLITLTKLNQQSQQHLSTLERSSEDRVRGACRQVFAEVGETMRRRLLDILPPPPETEAGQSL